MPRHCTICDHSDEQKARMEEIRQAGGIAEMVRNLEDVHRIFGKDGRITINL